MPPQDVSAALLDISPPPPPPPLPELIHSAGTFLVVLVALLPPAVRLVPSLLLGLLRSQDLRRNNSPPFPGGFKEAVATAGIAACPCPGVAGSPLATGKTPACVDDGGEVVGWQRRQESASLCPFLCTERSSGGLLVGHEIIVKSRPRRPFPYQHEVWSANNVMTLPPCALNPGAAALCRSSRPSVSAQRVYTPIIT